MTRGPFAGSLPALFFIAAALSSSYTSSPSPYCGQSSRLAGNGGREGGREGGRQGGKEKEGERGKRGRRVDRKGRREGQSEALPE